jgi:hypothetical protein
VQLKPLTLAMCVVWILAGSMAVLEDLKPDLLTSVVLLVCAASLRRAWPGARIPAHLKADI